MKKLHGRRDSETGLTPRNSKVPSGCSPFSDNHGSSSIDWDDVGQWHSTPINSGKTYSKKNIQSVSTIQEDSEDAYTYVSTYTEATGDTSCDSVEVLRQHASYREIKPAISPPLVSKYDSRSESVEIVNDLPENSVQEKHERTPPSLTFHAEEPKTPVKESRRKYNSEQSLTETESVSLKTDDAARRETRHIRQFSSKRSSSTGFDSSPDILSGKFEQQLVFASRLTSTPTKQGQGPLDNYWTNMSPIEKVLPDTIIELVPHESQGVVCSQEIHVETPEDDAKRDSQIARDNNYVKIKREEVLCTKQKAKISNEAERHGPEVASEVVKHIANLDTNIRMETDETEVQNYRQKKKVSEPSQACTNQSEETGSSSQNNKEEKLLRNESDVRQLKEDYYMLPERTNKETNRQEIVKSACEEDSDSSIEIVDECVQLSQEKKGQDKRHRKKNVSKHNSELASGQELKHSSKSPREPAKRKVDRESRDKKAENRWKRSKKSKKLFCRCKPCFIEQYAGAERKIKQNLKVWRVKTDTHRLSYREWVKTIPQDFLEVF